VKNAFGVEEVSKLNLQPIKSLKSAVKGYQRMKLRGRGPGAELGDSSVPALPKKPAAPVGNFVHYDPGLLAQKQRAAMKASFGKSLISKKVVQRDGKWVAVSEDGSRKFGTYDSPNKAKQRIHQVDYFKAKGEQRKQKEQVKGAVGAAGGATAAHAAYLTAGYTANHKVQSEFDRSRADTNPETKWKRSEKSSWFKHQTRPPEDFKGSTQQWRDSPRFYREFPENLPGAKARRVLGWTHGGKVGHAVAATNMAVGGVLGYKAMRHDKGRTVAKSITFKPKYGWSLRSLDQSGLLVPAGTIGGAGAVGYALGGRKRKRKAKK
jgi:hypothetical protein